MKDTEPGGKLYDEALHRGAAVARKVNEADGPLHLDATEAATLKVILLGLQAQAEIAQEANRSIAEALYRNQLQVVHRANTDGSGSYDLAPTPNNPATIN